jgi:hypothetical protein
MGNEVMLGRPLGGPLGGALGLRPAATAAAAAPTLRVLLVGGGGAGDRTPGTSNSSGHSTSGGAGGQVLEVEITAPDPGAYAVTIGLGGTVLSATPFGGVTRFGTLLSADGGGGGGAAYYGTITGPDVFASGFNACGPGGYQNSPRAHGGFPGGNFSTDYSTYRGGPGGGGSGGAGGNATTTTGGTPGPGKISSISGAPVEYGKGGQGGHTIGGAGPAASGPGGGGGGAVPGSSTGGANGNAGILIISYETGTQTWTGGTVTQVGNRTIHTLTADGTLTRTS